MISNEEKFVYQPIIEALVELGYTPMRKRTKGFILSFNNITHNRNKFVYTYTFPNGESKAACGAFVLEIPDVTLSDVNEIKKLINEQHEYFMKNVLYVPK